ncbi:hypothetical protein L798_14803 [Zootermopsis nevadensis]|uniref:Uncharacterized protein n=1 Tax=Zootermopsis nevadensis TaxID=136037 RepID=A0A067QPD9_ZOONE|nr:hypothetical protein L798_14803 [Zootermopsis nevadensis]
MYSVDTTGIPLFKYWHYLATEKTEVAQKQVAITDFLKTNIFPDTHLDWNISFLWLTTFLNEFPPLVQHNIHTLGKQHCMFNPWIIHLLPVFESSTADETYCLVSLTCLHRDTATSNELEYSALKDN